MDNPVIVNNMIYKAKKYLLSYWEKQRLNHFSKRYITNATFQTLKGVCLTILKPLKISV